MSYKLAVLLVQNFHGMSQDKNRYPITEDDRVGRIHDVQCSTLKF